MLPIVRIQFSSVTNVIYPDVYQSFLDDVDIINLGLRGDTFERMDRHELSRASSCVNSGTTSCTLCPPSNLCFRMRQKSSLARRARAYPGKAFVPGGLYDLLGVLSRIVDFI